MELTREMVEAVLSCVEGVCLIEEDSHSIVYINKCMAESYGGQIEGEKCYHALMGRDSPCPFCPPLLENGPVYTWDHFDANSNRWIKIKNRLLTLGGVRYRVGNLNTIADMMGLSRDAIVEMGELNRIIGAYRQAKADLEYDATHDRMTRLYNRNQYVRDLSGGRRSCSVGVLFFDLNNLKQTNDCYRHAAGDMLLCRLAAALGPADSQNRQAYRIGGDEFVVIYQGCTCEALDGCLADILTDLDRRNAPETIPCVVAVGVAWSADVADLEQLVSLADRRMYEDKRKKKQEGPIASQHT